MYAEVAVDFPSGASKTYTYSVPAHLAISPGDLVLAPFGARTLAGIVFSLTLESSVNQPREIIKRLSTGPLLTQVQLDLACWLSHSYLCPLYEAASLSLPPGAEPRSKIVFNALGETASSALDSLTGEERRLHGFIAAKGRVEVGAIKRAFPLHAEALLDQLLRRKLLARATVFVERPGPAYRAGAPDRHATVGPVQMPAAGPLELSPAQREAWRHLEEALCEENPRGSRVFLLHGVTGSGKTEMYLLALGEAVRRGRQAIVLVPEIALTPQTVERFAARFPGRVAVLHSGLSSGEYREEWLRIRDGGADVVIGSVGAIFAPVPNLGLIVIDEEHEWTYKRDLQSPRYHTREVAIRLGQLTGAIVILGSATPDVASYFRARNGDYVLLSLPERVSESGSLPLPHIDVVDLRQELREGNRSMFSRALQSAMKEALDRNEQIILFLNRRGTASVVVCRACGEVLQCRRCDLPLTYHSQGSGLVCHQCNLRRPVPDVCPTCWSDKIRYLGAGTQKVAEDASALFPQARLLRWDRDVTGTHRSHEAILRTFATHQADILIGTQMIAKGLHLPLVTLVGVVNADLGLHLPDFRAGERTFQILTQVAGRAGRGPSGGRVIVQTYSPGHYALVAASTHDYHAFYEKEIGYRRSLGSPPFSQLVRLVYSHSNNQAAEREASRLLALLKSEMEIKGHRGINMIGPAPCYFSRVRGRYRWHLVLRGKNPRDLLESMVLPPGWTLDVDPVSLL